MAYTIQLVGAPGSGKSTIAKYLSEVYEAPLFVEPFELNPFIPLLAEGHPVAFKCQEAMIELVRNQEYMASLAANKLAIIDGGLTQTAAFIEVLYQQAKLTSHEYITLLDTIGDIDQPIPDLTLHLHASGKVLKQRVKARGRDFEQGYTKKYLKSLRDAISYAGNTVTIDANESLDNVKSSCLWVANSLLFNRI